jgi:hypothetical protein
VGAYATGGTATSGAATGADPDIAAIFKHGSTGNGNSVIVIGESNAVGCGHIGGGSSSENC